MRVPVASIRPLECSTTLADRALAATAHRLAKQIRLGRLTPSVLVRPHASATHEYELLVGHTCWHATRLAAVSTLAVKLCSPEPLKAFDFLLSVARDPQRAPLATARAIQAVSDELHWASHLELGFSWAWPRNAISHYLLLLELPAEVQRVIERARLTFGHAKVLCSKALTSNPARQVQLAREAAAGGWSVRRLEASLKEPATGSPVAERPDPAIAQLEQHLSEVTGLRARIEHTAAGSGRFVFEYYSLEQTDNLLRFFPSSESA